MNSIDLRTEKANAIFRYQSFQTITTLFRIMEIIIFLVIISTFCSQLPFSVRVSADYFKGISFACISHRFVFVIGNVIVLTLLYISRVNESEDMYGKIDVYDECVKRCEKSVVVQEKKFCRSQSEKVMRVGCNDGERHRKLTRSVTEICRSQPEKTPLEICRRQTKKVKRSLEICENQPENSMKSVEWNNSQNQRKLWPEISRSQSEKVMRVECKDSQSHRKLKRSVTDCCGGETTGPEVCGVDELSSEAFRRTVEEFIARQQQSLRDEELAPVPYVGA